MFESNLANLTAQYQQAYLIYCYKIMRYLSLLAWIQQQQRPPQPKVKPKSASGVKKLAQEVKQEKPTLKSLKHQRKSNVSTIVAMGFPNGAMSAAFRVAFNHLASRSSYERLNKSIRNKRDKQIRVPRQPGKVNITTHRISEDLPYHMALEFDDGTTTRVLSAGPVGIGLEGAEFLVGGLGRPSDIPSNNFAIGTVQPPDGYNDAQYFQLLVDASNDYNNRADYDFFPGIADGYNSNSYVSGLINVTGGTPSVNLNQFVGGGKPLDSAYFPNTTY